MLYTTELASLLKELNFWLWFIYMYCLRFGLRICSLLYIHMYLYVNGVCVPGMYNALVQIRNENVLHKE